MTSAPSSTPAGLAAKPNPSIYTVLLIVAILVLAVTLVVVLWTLMSPMPKGYGLQFGDLFAPLKEVAPAR